MTEEEKEAIEIVKEITYIRGIREDVEGKEEDHETLDIVLNLINKQQKEIEVLREENFDTIYMKAVADFKDKIREKIKELQAMSISSDIYYTDIEKMFYELLEE